MNTNHKDELTSFMMHYGYIEKAFKMTIEMLPYRLVFGKAYYLSIQLERWAYWTVKKLDLYMKLAGLQCIFQLDELDEFWNEAYKNAKMYKELMF